MAYVRISVNGCDDYTQITEKLSEQEIQLLERIAKRITNTSEYSCMPTMEIERLKDE